MTMLGGRAKTKGEALAMTMSGRHCERSAAIHAPLLRQPWIATAFGLAMTDGGGLAMRGFLRQAIELAGRVGVGCTGLLELLCIFSTHYGLARF